MVDSETPASEDTGRTKRIILRWLAGLAVIALVIAALAAAGLWYTSRHLVDLARWGMNRAFPNVTLDLQSLSFVSPKRLEASRLVLKSRKDGATLLTMDQGVAIFQLGDLVHRKIGEIRLINPHLVISPRLPAAFTSEEKAKAASGSVWSISRLVCDYGDLESTGFGKNLPNVRTKFSCDLRDLSNGPGSNHAQQLVLWGLTAAAPGNDAAPFLSLDLVTIDFTLDALINRQELTSVALKGGNFLFNQSSQQFLTTQSSAPAPAPAASPSPAFKIASLDIKNVAIQIQEPGLRPNATGATTSNIAFQLSTKLKDVSPSTAVSAIGQSEQHVEISDLEVLSPFDPFVKVFTLHAVFIHFTFGELLQKKLRSVTILSPTIYVGDDLFWYMDDAKKRLASPTGNGASAGPGWIIDKFKLDYGELVIGSGGHTQYGVPLSFRTEADNVSLDNLAALQMNAVLQIPSQKYTFASYQLEISTEKGELRFSYPPGQNQNNLVGTIFLDQMRWRQYQAARGWLTTTFDHTGINGRFGSRAYGGYVSGGFSFPFDSHAPWEGWVAGRTVDLKQVSDVIAAKSFQVTGPIDFRVQLDAHGKKIDRIKGEFHVRSPGHMHIGKLDDIEKEFPPQWSMLKQSLTRISLETLKDFDYTEASGDCWFVLGQGILNLKMQGPGGSRNFEVVLHADNSPYGQWKNTTLQH